MLGNQTGNAWLSADKGNEIPITVTTLTGTVLTVHAAKETIADFYGDVNQLVAAWLKPLHAVERITVQVYDEFFGEEITVATYDRTLEAWLAKELRLVFTYDYYGTGIEDEDRGYLDRIEGWLPRYAIRYQRHAKQKHLIYTEDIVRIETAVEVNRRAKNARTNAKYHQDPKAWNKACVARRQRKKVSV